MDLSTLSINVQKLGERLTGNKVFTWDGYDYPCVPGSGSDVELLGDGGFAVDVSLVLKSRQEVFTDGIFPSAKQRITFAGQHYRILKVTKDALNTMVVLYLESVNKGV